MQLLKPFPFGFSLWFSPLPSIGEGARGKPTAASLTQIPKTWHEASLAEWATPGRRAECPARPHLIKGHTRDDGRRTSDLPRRFDGKEPKGHREMLNRGRTATLDRA